MKICINQYAFIAAILCVSTALHTKHEPLSKEALRLMVDQSNSLADNLKTLQDNAKTLKQRDIEMQRLDYKDKSITPRRRSEIRRLQRQSMNARIKVDLQIKNIQRFLDSTTNQISKATKQSSDSIRSIQLAHLRLPAN